MRAARRFVADGFDRTVAGARRQPDASAPKRAPCPWPVSWDEEADSAEAPTFTAAEVDAAVSAARQEGYACAEAEVTAALTTSQAERQAAALAALAAQLAASQAAFDRAVAARAGASRDLALTLAQILAGRALARLPLADVEAMVRDLVARLEAAPRLQLYLPPALVDAGSALLADVAAQVGYRGELLVTADPALGPGDARLCWQDGNATRDRARLEREAAAVVDAWLPPAAAELPAGEDRRDERNDSKP